MKLYKTTSMLMVLNSKNKPATKHEKDEYDKIST
jgi:hypothetical protein